MSRFIVVTSGKGGVGKTTTSINLAAAINYFDEDVTLVDINLTTPNIGLHLGAPVVPVTLNHVLMGKADLADAIYEHSCGAKIIPASLSIKELKRLDETNLPRILTDLRKLSDIVIFDSAAGLGSEAVSAIAVADEVIIVTNPEIPAVTDALKTVKIAQELGKDVLGVIVTRAKSTKYEMSIKSIQEMLESPILGVVPEDNAVQESLSLRNAVFLTHPKSVAAQSYKKIAARIVGAEIEPEHKGFFARLFGK